MGEPVSQRFIESRESALLRMDSVGIVVDDLKAAIAFFVELGLELEGETTVEGQWVDRVVGLDGVRSVIVMMRTPDGSRLELSKFQKPKAITTEPNTPVNTLGIRRIMFAVTDIDDVVARLQKRGAELVGEVVQYEDMYRLCYLRGPEGILVALAEQLGMVRPAEDAKQEFQPPKKDRQCDLDHFYALLDALERRLGGRCRLARCHGGMDWPRRGVYFIFEEGELRADGRSPRVVRVGTHALKAGAKSTLWGRLAQHRGTQSPPGGNHRGSVFRRHVGTALLDSGLSPVLVADTWGIGQSGPPAVRARERPLEVLVSETIGAMDVLWLPVDDFPGPESRRALIERNAIGLLSNCGAMPAIDSPSKSWLGHHARATAVRGSGLWNVDHVEASYDPGFLQIMNSLVRAVR